MAFDRQAAFDKAAKGVIAQGKQSLNSRGTCYYRGVGGTCCGVGHLIPDDLYHRDMENGRPQWRPDGHDDFSKRNHRIAVAAGAESVEDSYFLRDLQCAHDAIIPVDGDFIDHFKRAMRQIAGRHDLNPAVLDEAA